MTAAAFVENWFTDESCSTLADLVRRVESVPGRIVELGSWEGRSTLAIADATGRPVHAVDHWDGAATDRYQREQVKTRNIYQTWRSNLTGHDHVTPYRMDWLAYTQLERSPVALVFIDADHTYPEVCAQIDAFRPLVSPGGIICGDDYPMRPVARAVRSRLKGHTVEGRVWSWRS
jgi:predicted O-methyltransferase YrrM